MYIFPITVTNILIMFIRIQEKVEHSDDYFKGFQEQVKSFK